MFLCSFQGCTSQTLTAQNVRDTIVCSNCAKPRCVYMQKQLSEKDARELKSVKRRFGTSYICGCAIAPDDSGLLGKVFTRLELACSSPIEWAYYGTNKINVRKDRCTYCAKKGVTVDQELKKEFKTVLPLCGNCKAMGKKTLTRMPIAGKSKKK